MSELAEWDFPDDVVESEDKEPLIIKDILQGSDEWLSLRAGKITSSKVHCIMAQGKGLTKDKYMVELAVERITGQPIQGGYKSKAMLRGNEDEPLAREFYEFANDVDVEQVTFVIHPSLINAGASPDGLVGSDGLLEIKNPNMETHVSYLLSKKIPSNYLHQVYWQMACTGRLWCDWMTYCKEMPIHLRSMVIRVYRDEKKINELENTAHQFNEEVEQLIAKLENLK